MNNHTLLTELRDVAHGSARFNMAHVRAIRSAPKDVAEVAMRYLDQVAVYRYPISAAAGIMQSGVPALAFLTGLTQDVRGARARLAMAARAHQRQLDAFDISAGLATLGDMTDLRFEELALQLSAERYLARHREFCDAIGDMWGRKPHSFYNQGGVVTFMTARFRPSQLVGRYARGRYQVSLLHGGASWSGSDLMGNAKRWSNKYAQSRDSLLCKVQAGYWAHVLRLGARNRLMLIERLTKP